MEKRITLAVTAGVAGAALLTSLAVTPLIRLAAIRFRLLDHPNERSSHRAVVPRGGGLAVLASAGACLAAAHTYWSSQQAATAVLAGVLLLAVVGLIDDRYTLPVSVRLVAQLVAAALVVGALGPLERLPLPAPVELSLGPAAVPLTLLWIAAVANFYNFMDGIDGIAGVQGVVTGLAIAAADWDPFATLAGAGLAGGCAGFLRLNWSPARIFMGDAGSVPLGFSFAVLPLLAPADVRSPAVFVVALSLWFFLADASFTLLARTMRGRRWHEAHREHLYQRVADSGISHAHVAAAIGLGGAGVGALALVAFRSGAAIWAWAAVGVAAALFAVEWHVAHGQRKRWVAA